MASQQRPPAPGKAAIQTRILKVDPLSSPAAGGVFRPKLQTNSQASWSQLDIYDVSACPEPFLAPLREAATYLSRGRRPIVADGHTVTGGAHAEEERPPPLPVAFPTETVYGLGADATRSDAVRAIYTAKGRPSDNPLIVHVCDLEMLRRLLQPAGRATAGRQPDDRRRDGSGSEGDDPIPAIYRPLITRFWPGPLTILLPLPPPSPSHAPPLAPEVTAGLSTFGARMPASPLALTLIRLAGVPLAAPSANASTRPSPTTAQHVVDDLAGRIEIVLDGGACGVGVESTVVDGLSSPPVVLRPGGVGIDELRQVPGWEGTVVAYKDAVMREGMQTPRAPGMKYKHYSPRARVVLFERTSGAEVEREVREIVGEPVRGNGEPVRGKEQPGGVNGNAAKVTRTVAFIRTGGWKLGAGLELRNVRLLETQGDGGRLEQSEALSSSSHGDELGGKDSRQNGDGATSTMSTLEGSVQDQDVDAHGRATTTMTIREGFVQDKDVDADVTVRILDIDLGSQIRAIAQGLFAALRDLDSLGADVILVEGIPDDMDIAAAVMNRLRKAASEIRT